MLASARMSTTQLGSSRPAAGGRSSRGAAGALGAQSGVARAPIVLAAALLALVLYAAFDHGAIDAAAETRIEVAIAALAALALGAWLWSGTLRLSAPWLAFAGIGLLSAFAVWSGITMIWSVSPDHTWTELNLAIAYVIVLCLAVALGASLVRSVELVSKALVVAAFAVSVYALGQKVLPGIHVDGIFNLNRTGSLAAAAVAARLLERACAFHLVWGPGGSGVRCRSRTTGALAAPGARRSRADAARDRPDVLPRWSAGADDRSRGFRVAQWRSSSLADVACGRADRDAPAAAVRTARPPADDRRSLARDAGACRCGARADRCRFADRAVVRSTAPDRSRSADEARAGPNPHANARARRTGGSGGGRRRARAGRVLARADRHRLARMAQLHDGTRGQRHESESAAVGGFREPLGLVERGCQRVRRPPRRRVGGRLVRRRASALSP